MRDIADLFGRIFLAFIFLFEAYDTVRFKTDTKLKMVAYGIEWNQNFLYNTAATILVIGSITILLGYRSTFGALLLLLYWLPVTFIVHDFWNIHDIEAWRTSGFNFMKNLAIAGGLLMMMANKSGKYSVKSLLSTTKVNQW